METALTLQQVATQVGASKATIKRWVAAGDFPPPRRLGPRTVRWLLSEVDGWLSAAPLSGKRVIRR